MSSECFAVCIPVRLASTWTHNKMPVVSACHSLWDSTSAGYQLCCQNEMTLVCHGVERNACAHKSRWRNRKREGERKSDGGKMKMGQTHKHTPHTHSARTHTCKTTHTNYGKYLHRSVLSWGRGRDSDLSFASGQIRSMVASS